MEGLGLREGKNATRRGRLEGLKKGPGVFVYDGSLHDTEYVPTPQRHSGSEPVFDDAGMPVVDGAGRQVFIPAGKVRLDVEGKPKLGGPPKIKKHVLDTFRVRNVLFPKGEHIEVNSTIALKIRGMIYSGVSAFAEIDLEAEPAEGESEEPKAKKRGKGKKVEAESAEG